MMLLIVRYEGGMSEAQVLDLLRETLHAHDLTDSAWIWEVQVK